MASGFKGRMMQDEHTIVVPRHGNVVLLYAPFRHRVVFPTLREVRDECDVRTIRRLREIRHLAATYNNVLLYLCDPLPPREWILRAIRSVLVAMPIVLETPDPDANAWLLEEGLVDCLVPPGTGPLVRRATLLNLFECSAAAEQMRRQNTELSHRSISDSLTRLYNHGHLLEMLDREFRRADRTREPLSCLMVDIDHFKAVNDTHGHRFGDYVLAEIAMLLRGSLRQSDIVGRYGGEEFMVILPDTDAPSASTLAEKLRRIIEDHSFVHADCQSAITASFGVATNTDQGVFEPDHLLQLADRALYFAKEGGRNRVCAAQDYETITDFDVYRHRLTSAGLPVPVVLLLTRSGALRATFENLADTERWQLICFEEFRSFSDGFETLAPNLAVMDLVTSPCDGETLRHVAERAAETTVPVVAVREPAYAGETNPADALDDTLPPHCPPSEMRLRLRNLLRLAAAQRESRRLAGDLRLAQRRLIRNERLRSVGEMASGMAHDFNNALSVVLGAAHLLARHPGLPEDARALARNIEQAAQEGAASVNRLQAFVSPDQVREQSRHVLTRLVEEALHLTRTRWRDEALAKQKHYTVENLVEAGIDVAGNPTELKEVLVNLILNSLDSMENGGRIVFEAAEAGKNVLLSVSDDGQGMDAETLRGIFDPFFNTKHERSGGLGLYFVYTIMKRHGGQVDIDSLPGRGTTVTLTFPKLPLPDHPYPNATPTPDANAKADLDPPRKPLSILVIDDEPKVRDVHARMLGSLGHNVQTAADGFEALERVAVATFDVVFIDLAMPQISGWETARKLRDRCPGTVLVLLSGWGSSQGDEMLQACGISHVMAKPVTTRQLRDVLARISAPTDRTR